MNAGCVEVRALRLDGAPTTGLEATLSPDELARAGRFRSGRDRARFVAARGFLRVVLGRALGIAPGEVRLRYGVHGKPALDESFAASGLRFNVSHSADLALVALARNADIGVDLERLRPIPELAAIAANHFGPNERRALGEVPTAARLQAFHRLWTAKEAWLKATGVGLTGLEAGFEVAWDDDTRGRIEEAGKAKCAPLGRVHSWSPEPGYVAALAQEGEGVPGLAGAGVGNGNRA